METEQLDWDKQVKKQKRLKLQRRILIGALLWPLWLFVAGWVYFLFHGETFVIFATVTALGVGSLVGAAKLVVGDL